jgi:hypothetical protein
LGTVSKHFALSSELRLPWLSLGCNNLPFASPPKPEAAAPWAKPARHKTIKYFH